MERRDFFKKAGITSAALVSLPAFAGPAPAKTGHDGQDEHEHEHGHGPHEDLNGPLASATVAFGQWNADPVIDRFPNNSPRTQNNHHLIPGEAVIKAGGSVNFIISGFHHLLVYGDGTKPTDINITKLDSHDRAARPAADRRREQQGVPRSGSERASHAARQHTDTASSGPRRSGAVSQPRQISGDLRRASPLL